MESASVTSVWPERPTHPDLFRFASLANERMVSDPDDGFFSLESAFRHLVFSSGFLGSVANTELRGIASNEEYDSPLWGPDSLLIAGNGDWQLRAGLYTRQADFIYTLPYHFMVAVVSAGMLQANVHSLPDAMVNDIFEPGLRLDPPRVLDMEAGCLLVVDNRRELLDVVVSGPVLAIKLCGNFNNVLQWAFDRSTRQATQAIAANAGDSELVSMARALGAMENSAAESSLLELIAHPRHFVRWAALQALARISPEHAIERLRVAAESDPHPHLLQASRKALHAIQGQG